jgi:GntR family transcriptional repressor for pyruvate dehydrogenase complex
VRLPEKIARALEKAILKGEYPAGSRFPPERELAERYKVSRSTIREAVGMLAQLGLVETFPQSGTYVGNYLTEGSLDLLLHIMKASESVDADVVLSLMEFRRMSEIFAVRKAVRNAAPEDTARLWEIVHREREPGAGTQEVAEADYALHLAIVEMAGNLVLQLLFNSFKPVYRFYANFFFRLPEALDVTVSQHERFMRAFESGEADAAAAVMEEALLYGEKRVCEALEMPGRNKNVPWNMNPGPAGEPLRDKRALTLS